MSDMCVRRLRRELQSLAKNPIEGIEAVPLESNLREWHFVLTFSAETDYFQGCYHGKLEFSKEYPMKPPAIRLMTPSGRFKEGSKLCFSFSDFHPESWNPMWSVSTILVGFQSFMLDTDPTLGSIETTSRQRKLFASKSLAFNVKDKQFCECFPHLVEKHEKIQLQNQLNGPVVNGAAGSRTVAESGAKEELTEWRGRQEPSSSTIVFSLGISVVILAVVFKLCS